MGKELTLTTTYSMYITTERHQERRSRRSSGTYFFVDASSLLCLHLHIAEIHAEEEEEEEEEEEHYEKRIGQYLYLLNFLGNSGGSGTWTF